MPRSTAFRDGATRPAHSSATLSSMRPKRSSRSAASTAPASRKLRRARTAVGTVYNDFAQKDDFLSALLEERTEELLAQLLARREDPKGFQPRLQARVMRMLAYVEQHRAFFAIANEHGLFAGTAAPGARVATR